MRTKKVLGVLVPINPDQSAPAPEARPVGRAALALRARGIDVVFGDALADGQMTGVLARPGRWEKGCFAVSALHDRYPSQIRAARFASIQQARQDLPMGNPLALTLMCRDKLACQRVLERAIPGAMPEVEERPAKFGARLKAWGSGFLKPQYGALGTGVMRVLPGDVLPARLPGVVPGVEEPAILQRAVRPPVGWAGQSVRVLCQRLPDGDWHQCEPVVRRSRTDPVVNAARGADVGPGTDWLPSATLERVGWLCQRVCAVLSAQPDGRWLVEMGIDLVLDPDMVPHVIEVNSRPRGRLEVLAAGDPQRFAAAHFAACARPIERLAAMVDSGPA